MPHSNWQPIGTAPKDGTRVLIYDPDDDYYLNRSILPEPTIYVCFWNDYHEYWVEAEGERYSGFKPTHWMPLPEPPTKG